MIVLKNITVESGELLDQDTANTWLIQNTVLLKSLAWFIMFQIPDILLVKFH